MVSAHVATTPPTWSSGHTWPLPQAATRKALDGGGLEVARGRRAGESSPVTEGGEWDSGVVFLGYIPKFHPRDKVRRAEAIQRLLDEKFPPDTPVLREEGAVQEGPVNQGTREQPEINMLGYEWLAFLVFGLAAALILAFVVWVTAEICQSSCTHGEAEN